MSWSRGSETVSWIFAIEGDGHGSSGWPVNLGQVHGPDGEPGAGERALQLHEATGVDRDHRARAGAHDGVDLGARHGAGDFVELDGERAAESAALFGDVHLAQLEAAHVPEQAARAVLDVELAQRVAAVVIGDDFFAPGAHVVDAGHVEQELRKLPNFRSHRARGFEHLRLLGKKLLEMMRDHGRAGAGGHDHIIRGGEHGDRKCRATSRASWRNPLLKAGWPQQVWASGKSTAKPARSRTFSHAPGRLSGITDRQCK